MEDPKYIQLIKDALIRSQGADSTFNAELARQVEALLKKLPK